MRYLGCSPGYYCGKPVPITKKQAQLITTGSFGNAGDNFFVRRPAIGFTVTTRLAVTTAAPGTSGAARHVVCVSPVFTAT